MYYIDACIWRDYREDRSDRFRPLGEWAFRFLRSIAGQDIVLIYEMLLDELHKKYAPEEVAEMLDVVPAASRVDISASDICLRIASRMNSVLFLSIEPNTPGVTVVITKHHLPSDALRLSHEQLSELTLAAKKVARRLEAAFADVGRVGLVYEEYGVDHVHAKLFPLHGTKGAWKRILSDIDDTFDTYLHLQPQRQARPGRGVSGARGAHQEPETLNILATDIEG